MKLESTHLLKRKMIKYTPLILFLFISSILHAQHTVSGIVSDKAEKTLLLQDVSVFIPEFNRLDLSKEGGTYILRNVGIGTVTLQFTKRGYKSVVQTISTKDSATVVNVEMEPSIKSPEEVTDVSGQTKLAGNTPFINQAFSGYELRRRGQSSFLTTLTYEPGLDKFSYGSLSKPIIRGLSFNHIAYYQSSVPIGLFNRTWYELSAIALMEEGIERVEVIKGPATILYGENAMGGVMIFTDEKMPMPGTIKGDVNFGFFTNTVGFNADAAIKGSGLKGEFFLVRMGGKSHTSYIQGNGDLIRKNTEAKEFAYNSGYATGSFKGTGGVSKKWGQSKISFSYLKQQNELVRSLTDSAVAQIENNEERNRKILEPFIENSLLIASTENIILIKKSSIRFNASWQGNNSEGYDKFSGQSVDLKYISNPSKPFGYTVGTQGRFSHSGVNSIDEPHYKTKGFGIYSLLRYDLAKVSFLGGVRYDSKSVVNTIYLTDKKYSIPSVSAGLAFHASDEVTFKLNASTGFSVPVEEQDIQYIFSYGYLPASLSELLEEKNVGGDFELSWLHRNVSLCLNAFVNKIQNYLYQQPNEVDFSKIITATRFYFFQSDATFYGGEFSFQIHPVSVKWLSLGSNYSISRGEFDASTYNVPLMPADKIVSNVTFQSDRMNYLYRPFIRITLRNYLKQDRPYTFIEPNDLERNYETPTDGFNLLDIDLGGTFHLGKDEFDVSLSVSNIFNTGHYNHLSRLKYLSPVAVREMGRDISIRLHIPIGIKNAK